MRENPFDHWKDVRLSDEGLSTSWILFEMSKNRDASTCLEFTPEERAWIFEGTDK